MLLLLLLLLVVVVVVVCGVWCVVCGGVGCVWVSAA